MRPEEYLAIEREQIAIIEAAEEKRRVAFAEALRCAVPDRLRPAEPSDIVEGRVVWIQADTTRYVWHVVDVVLCPDAWDKSFVARDGCRYGLDRCYVEVEP